MSHMNRIFLAAVASSALLGCAAAPPLEGDRVTLRGKLVLKGSAPMVRPTLQQNEQTSWDLKAVDLATAIELQNRTVVVTGVVVRPEREPTLLRSIKVTKLRPAD